MALGRLPTVCFLSVALLAAPIETFGQDARGCDTMCREKAHDNSFSVSTVARVACYAGFVVFRPVRGIGICRIVQEYVYKVTYPHFFELCLDECEVGG